MLIDGDKCFPGPSGTGQLIEIRYNEYTGQLLRLMGGHALPFQRGIEMFGLMKSCGCSQTREQRLYHRLHYCGTCKTIGSLYGQSSRVMLNSDAVFLGEVLSALSDPAERLNQWRHTYKSNTCFPGSDQFRNNPLSLQFAATAGLLMAEFKIADRIEDSNRYLWKLPLKFFSKPFRAASIQLTRWKIPVSDLWNCWHLQCRRERELEDGRISLSSVELIDYLAEPTAVATGLIFQHGACVVGNPEVQSTMQVLGRSFGSLLYLLDALEDYETDFHARNFNGLRAAFDLSEDRLPDELREWSVDRLWGLAAEIERTLHQLPLSPTLAAHFTQRLKANLAKRLGQERPVSQRIPARAQEPISSPAVSSVIAMLTAKVRTCGSGTARSRFAERLRTMVLSVSALVFAFERLLRARTAAGAYELIPLAAGPAFMHGLEPSMAAASLSTASSEDLPEMPPMGEGLEQIGEHVEKKKRCCGGGGDDSDGGCCSCCDCCGDCGSCCECASCCD
jgi:hypothetical protein